jgi:hypothetical protein
MVTITFVRCVRLEFCVSKSVFVCVHVCMHSVRLWTFILKHKFLRGLILNCNNFFVTGHLMGRYLKKFYFINELRFTSLMYLWLWLTRLSTQRFLGSFPNTNSNFTNTHHCENLIPHIFLLQHFYPITLSCATVLLQHTWHYTETTTHTTVTGITYDLSVFN